MKFKYSIFLSGYLLSILLTLILFSYFSFSNNFNTLWTDKTFSDIMQSLLYSISKVAFSSLVCKLRKHDSYACCSPHVTWRILNIWYPLYHFWLSTRKLSLLKEMVQQIFFWFIRAHGDSNFKTDPMSRNTFLYVMVLESCIMILNFIFFSLPQILCLLTNIVYSWNRLSELLTGKTGYGQYGSFHSSSFIPL